MLAVLILLVPLCASTLLLTALGGAFVGNEIEKTQAQGSRYRIAVQLDSGSALVVEDARDVNLRVGDRVRVENNRVYRI